MSLFAPGRNQVIAIVDFRQQLKHVARVFLHIRVDCDQPFAIRYGKARLKCGGLTKVAPELYHPHPLVLCVQLRCDTETVVAATVVDQNQFVAIAVVGGASGQHLADTGVQQRQTFFLVAHRNNNRECQLEVLAGKL